MKLYIDIGNSRIRLATDQQRVDDVKAFYYRPDTLVKIVEDYCTALPFPERVLVANVAGESVATALDTLCRSRWSIRPVFLSASADSCGITNAYTNPAQLGVDRWLAIIAAWHKFRDNLCVFDCGSAVTADMVDADGMHGGGYIIPGRHMMQQALIHGTGQIRLGSVYRFTGGPGRSTDECVYNGTTYAIAAFIEYTMRQLNDAAEKTYLCVITGGGADALCDLLRIRYKHEPYLVIEGIRVLDKN